MSPRVLVVVQARVGSTRLPGKVLLPVGGAPLLQRMMERLAFCETAFDRVVATTTDTADDILVTLCDRLEIPVFRGHPTDLLDRHVQAARAFGADVVVKIPSDCPLVDPRVVDEVIAFSLARRSHLDFVSNLHPQSWPDGNDVEVMSRDALETAHREATEAHEREHTTPFLWDHPERFRIGNVAWSSGRDLSKTHRLTVDWAEDLALVDAVFRALHRDGAPPFSVEAIVSLLDAHPMLHALNARFAGCNWYRHHLDALRTIGADDTKHPEGIR
jgi:spore coat polysaccharide biosynthesis protein SpsF